MDDKEWRDYMREELKEVKLDIKEICRNVNKLNIKIAGWGSIFGLLGFVAGKILESYLRGNT